MRAKRRTHRVETAIAALAGRQHGVVARPQLLDLGLGRRAIAHRIELGRLHPIHRGVYAVGHRVLSREGAYMAAVLIAPASAVLSHRSAAALWGIRHSDRADVEITVPRAIRERRAIDAHTATLPADEVTTHNGIPVTTPPRTLLDLAAVLTPTQLERAINEAESRRLGDPLPLAALVARYPRRRGVPAIRRLLDAQQVGRHITRSELEIQFLAVLDAHGIPRPQTNARVHLRETSPEIDCLWPAHKVTVELDSYDNHTTRAAFERDRARDRALQAAGYRVLRITWRQLHDEPHGIARQLEPLLGLR
jgi:predicted transcriptional regulator of viral defense system